MKTRNITVVGTVLKYNRNIVESEKLHCLCMFEEQI